MSQEPDHNSLEDSARDLLGSLPERWGRMDTMSRTALVEVGKALQRHKMLDDSCKIKKGLTGGLIVGSTKGSLAVDLEFAKTMQEGPGMASPHLFGYTLPNIPLAEAAIQYGLTGPVFSLISDDPYIEAQGEAQRWLNDLPGETTFIIAGAIDVLPTGGSTETKAKFNILQSLCIT